MAIHHRRHARRQALGLGRRGYIMAEKGFHFIGAAHQPRLVAHRNDGAIDQLRVLGDALPEFAFADEAIVQLELQEQGIVAAHQALIGLPQQKRYAPEFVAGGRGQNDIDQAGFVAGVNLNFTPDYPMGATFTGRAWSEPTLLRLAYAFEQATMARRMPPDVPALEASCLH